MSVVRIYVFFSLLFLVACGGSGSGGGSGSVDISVQEIINQYTGNKKQAEINESNYREFFNLLYLGLDSSVFSDPSFKVAPSEKSYNFNPLSPGEILSNRKSLKQFKAFGDSQLFAKETVYCQSGTGNISGGLSSSSLTGVITVTYDNCKIGGLTVTGVIDLIVHSYDMEYGYLTHASSRYKDLKVKDGGKTYITSGIIDEREDGDRTIIENSITTYDDRQVLLENFRTVHGMVSNVDVSGKVYHDEYGYFLVETRNELYDSYNSNSLYVYDSGVIALSGYNQTITVTHEGYEVRIKFLDDQGISQTAYLTGDPATFTVEIIQEMPITTGSDILLSLSQPLNTRNISLNDLSLKDDDLNSIPSKVVHDSEHDRLIITPKVNLKPHNVYKIELEGEWYSIYGKKLSVGKRDSITTSTDEDGPRVVSISPSTTKISRETKFVITFNEEIDTTKITNQSIYLRMDSNSGLYDIPPVDSVFEGNTLTISPLEKLLAEEDYELRINVVLRDLGGNPSHIIIERVFSTEHFENRIDLSRFNSAIKQIEVDKLNNKLYILDAYHDSEIHVVDLTTDVKEATYSLGYWSSRFCIDPISDKIYITSRSSSTIEERRLSSFEKIVSIPWSTVINFPSYEAPVYKIKCLNEKLLVTDAESTYTINRDAPYTETQIALENTFDDIVINSSGQFYTTTSVDSNTLRLSLLEGSASTTWTIMDETDPLQDYNNWHSPIFFNEEESLILNRRYILNSLDLKEVHHDFGFDNNIYAVDFHNRRIATETKIYSLDTYEELRSLPVSGATGLVFDNEGDLYFIKYRKEYTLYYLKKSEMQTH